MDNLDSSSSSSRSKRSPSAKSGLIQPGAMVSAFYGPFGDETPGSEKRRSRTKIRGAVLSSHNKNSWLVHWFLVGTNAHAPFNKLKVEDAADSEAKKYVDKLLQENPKNYIGGPDQLRHYIDSYVKQAGSTSNKRKPGPSGVTDMLQWKRSKDSAVRRLPMSMEKAPVARSRDSAKDKEHVQLSPADSQQGE